MNVLYLETDLLEELDHIHITDGHIRRHNGDGLDLVCAIVFFSKRLQGVLASLCTRGDAEATSVGYLLHELQITLPTSEERLGAHAHDEILWLRRHRNVHSVHNLFSELHKEL